MGICLPNFFLIGAPRSGTTTLHNHLRAHPEIYMSPSKEPFFLAYLGGPPPLGPGDTSHWVLERSSYEELFRRAGDAKAIGEASSGYLYSERARKNLGEQFPNAKLLAILRDPVERAYSHYLYRRHLNTETLGVREAFAAESGRIQRGWHAGHYKNTGFYAAQLEDLLSRFCRDQVAIYLYDDLVADPEGLMRSIYRFLDVDSNFRPDTSQRYGLRSGRSRSDYLQLALKDPPDWLRRAVRVAIPRKDWRSWIGLRAHTMNRKEPPPLDQDLRMMLVESYTDDVRKLEGLIGRDLSHWLQGTHTGSE